MVVVPALLRIAQHHDRYPAHVNRLDIAGISDPDRFGGSRGAV